ncbi:MAG: 3-hydroxyacyl-ACP dehydratase FabZ family protein [Phycisphaerae bacterium]|jgi:3-hydroxyacyl-[acyl-carrier-protein] dehydratase
MNTSHDNVHPLDALQALPHRPPFRFVSALTSLTPGVTGEGEWRVTGSEDFFRGHFPGDPIVPGVLIAESLAQLSGVVWLAHASSATARLAHVNVKVLAPVIPPASVALVSRLTKQMADLAMFDVAAHMQRNGTAVPVATGTLVLARAGGAA